MPRAIIILFISCLCALTVGAQKPVKSWTEWDKKDADKILNNSPWGQTQIETDVSEMFFTPQADPRLAGKKAQDTLAARNERGGAANQATSVKYHIRFLSARPVRQAYARTMMLAQKERSTELGAYLQQFVTARSAQYIIVAVDFEAADQRYARAVMQDFNSAITDTLKNDTYLERKDGKRVFLAGYAPPGTDGLGAKFLFPRQLDEQPFLAGPHDEVRFFSALSKKINLNMRFKLADMIYDGQLEY